MRWFEKIIAAHVAVTNAVSHGERMQSERYFVWQEDGSNDFIAGNIHAEYVMTGSTDLFTKQEFDPWREEIGQAFDRFGVAWSFNSTQYEAETGFWHYEWLWEVTDG